MTAITEDMRPPDCRFRLRDEGRPYPRSGCRACGRTILTGLGSSCSALEAALNPKPDPADERDKRHG